MENQYLKVEGLEGLSDECVKQMVNEGKMAKTPARVAYWNMIHEGLTPQYAAQMIAENAARTEAKIEELVQAGMTVEYAKLVTFD